MASGLANFGYFAGGMATGIQAGSKLAREHEEEKRRREDHEYRVAERDREKKIRAAVGGRLGRVGQEVTTDYDMTGAGMTGGLDQEGFTPQRQTYTEDQAWRDAAGDVGRLGGDPLVAAQYRTTGMQLRRGQRQQDQENYADRLMQLARGHHNMDDDTFYSSLAQIATNGVPDGSTFGYNQGPDGQYQVGMIGRDGRLQMQPVTREQALEAAMQYISPQHFQQGQELGVKRRGVAVQERNAQTMEDYRRSQQPVLDAHADYYRAGAQRMERGPQATPMNAAQQYALRQQQEFDAQRTKIVQDLEGGVITQTEANRRMNMLSLKFGGQMRPEQQPRAGAKGLGDGVIQMEDGSLLQVGPDGVARKVQMPGQSAFDRYNASRGPALEDDGRPSIKSPDTFRRGVPPKSMQRVRDPLTHEMITPAEYKRKFGKEPETGV